VSGFKGTAAIGTKPPTADSQQSNNNSKEQQKQQRQQQQQNSSSSSTGTIQNLRIYGVLLASAYGKVAESS